MNLLDLPAVHAAIKDLDEDGIVAVATEAAVSQAGGWFACARAIGELQRRAKYKTAAVATYAKRLKVSRSTAFELGAIDRDILLPRLRERGADARFPIRERRFYSTAVKLAPSVRKSALAILKIAEEARARDRRFSTRKLRELVGMPSDNGRRRSIKQCLATLGALEAPARARFVRSVADPAGTLRVAEATVENVRALVDELRARVGVPVETRPETTECDTPGCVQCDLGPGLRVEKARHA